MDNNEWIYDSGILFFCSVVFPNFSFYKFKLNVIQKYSENKISNIHTLNLFIGLTVKLKSFIKLLYITAGVCESISDDVIWLRIYKRYLHSHSMKKSNLTRNETKVTP
jgi:hypothetical protein